MSERHRPWGTLLLKTLKVLESTENKSLRERKRAERDMRATRKKKREREKSFSSQFSPWYGPNQSWKQERRFGKSNSRESIKSLELMSPWKSFFDISTGRFVWVKEIHQKLNMIFTKRQKTCPSDESGVHNMLFGCIHDGNDRVYSEWLHQFILAINHIMAMEMGAHTSGLLFDFITPNINECCKCCGGCDDRHIPTHFKHHIGRTFIGAWC